MVLTDKEAFPQIPDVTAPFVYARLQGASEKIKTGYAPKDLDRLGQAGAGMGGGQTPGRSRPVGEPDKKPPKTRDVFVYMINGFKPKAPAAAMALIERLAKGGSHGPRRAGRLVCRPHRAMLPGRLIVESCRWREKASLPGAIPFR